jgi:hypothetical protein
MTVQFNQAVMVPRGFQQILAASLVTATKLTVPPGACIAVITLSVASTAVRYRDDGPAPTTVAGVILGVGAAPPNYPPFVYNGDINNVQFIASTGSPIMDIAYYGYG